MTRFRKEGYGGFRSWARWQITLRDAPRHNGGADNVEERDAGLHTIRVGTLSEVPSRLKQITELRLREAKYAVLGSTRFVVDGYCISCGWDQLLVTANWMDDNGVRRPAWRETAICRCGLNTRMRSVLDWLLNVEGVPADSKIYCTEATTRFFEALSHLRGGAVGSEHIPERAAPGNTDGFGVRCENLECLSFFDDSFDYVVSLDVLEHVFSYEAALRQLLRVLRPGGVAIMTFPFHFERATTVRRSALEGQAVRHLLPPIYHGDPLKQDGVLLVFDYGWDLIDTMYAIGWQDVSFTHVWSESKKYFGSNFILRAVK